MNCPKCGAALDGDSKFCVSCGANIDSFEEASNASSVRHENSNYSGNMAAAESGTPESKVRRKVDLIGLIIGTIFIIIGIFRITSAGTSISPTSFGGDFYTYTYRGIVAISEILTSIEVSVGWVIVAIGAAIDVSSLRR